MRYKKYIFILLLIMVLGCNRVYAANEEECFYTNSNIDFRARLTVRTGYENPWWHSIGKYSEIYVDSYGKKGIKPDLEHINNWYPSLYTKTTEGGYTFPLVYKDYRDANNNGKCPKYLVFQHCSAYKIWATDDANVAQKAVDTIKNANSDCDAYYSSYLSSDGKKKITEEDYWHSMIEIENPGVDLCSDADGDGVCDNLEEGCKGLFGDVTDAGKRGDNGKWEKAPSLAYMIHTALNVARIIVPILIIVLGSLDLAKATTAGKEDEMRKAQTTFVKRIIAGVAVFFVPVLIDLIMYLADMVWEGLGHCNINV